MISLPSSGMGGAELKLGYSDENGGKYESATQRFLKAKSDAKSPSDFLKGEFEYMLARVAAKQALADPDKREQAIQKLLAAQKAYPDHVRFYESILLLSQIQLAAKDLVGVRKTLESLSQAPWNDLKLAARIAEARVLVADGKVDEAIAAFDSVANSAGDSPSDASRKYEAMLGHARPDHAVPIRRRAQDSRHRHGKRTCRGFHRSGRSVRIAGTSIAGTGTHERSRAFVFACRYFVSQGIRVPRRIAVSNE